MTRVLEARTAPAWFLLLLVAAYAATASYDGRAVNDVHSAAHAAWSLATRGTLDLSGVDLPYDQAWTRQVDGAEYSNRFPGVWLAAVPAYLLFQPALPLVAPSALTAATASAVGVTGFLVALRRTVPAPWAWAGAAVLALGTGVWSVAADGLWGHGPAVMWLGLTVAGLSAGGRWRGLVAVAAAGAVLTRPHLAVALVVAAAVLWRRDRAGALATLLGVLVGAAGLLLYGRILFGTWSLLGPYELYGPARALQDGVASGASPVLWRLENVAMAVVSPRVGLLPAHPALLLALWALAHRVRDAPRMPVALALGGLAYAVVALLLTRVSGGYGFWGNRTLLESVVLVWPLLLWAVAGHRGGTAFRLLLSLTVAWAVAFHALGALLPFAGGPAAESLLHWPVPSALGGEPWRVVVAGLLGVVAGAVTWRLPRPPGPGAVTSGAQPSEDRPGAASSDASTSAATSTSSSSRSR